jgi:hypothetical protein
MKIIRLTSAWVFFATLLLLSPLVKAAEIGFSAALMTQHSGKGEIFSDQEAAAESAGIPLEVLVVADNLRFGYRRYDQYAKDTYSSGNIRGDGTAHFQTDVFSVSLIKQLEQSSQDFSFYGMAGLGLFQSVVTWEAYLTNGSSFYTQTTQRKTAESFNLGFLLGAGLQKKLGNAFIAGEVNYVNATLKYKQVNNEDDIDLDASGLFFSFVSGVSF